MYTLRIQHCSDQYFLDRFRTDLVNVSREVVILSPFLSNNRASHYYPVLSTLISRNVKVDVFARPQHEQPESLREHYVQVENALRHVGASLHKRPGMHEKIGVLDNEILWHGSLNILSHNDTRESMLRFESSELVAEILSELQLPSFKRTDNQIFLQEADATGSSACPTCAGKMIPFPDAGIRLCVRSPECDGKMPIQGSISDSEKRLSQVVIPCPVCEEPLNVSRGVFLRVTCSSEKCGFSLDPRLASSLLRVLKKKGMA